MNKSFSQDLVSNRKARYNYEILETFEAGLVLFGTEIKSLREHKGSLQEAYIIAEGNELWLINAQIPPYQFGNIHNHPEKRKRKLLMHANEIARLKRAVQEKGLSLIPLSIFLKGRWAKIKFAIGRGKKMHDKRESIKEKESKRAIEKEFKHR
jgi:SsrA-binding protein